MLPQGIDYNKYSSSSGMATKKWGPDAWSTLFTFVMGRYPIHIDPHNPEHMQLQHDFKNLFNSLKHIMPCIFCRNSFGDFIKELPLKSYLTGRIELMYWLYQMKDKVNQKLLKQEAKCYNDEKKRLKTKYHLNKISKEEYYNKLNEFKKNAFVTVPTPPFQQVLDQYESLRAVCSPKSLSCVLPQNAK